MSEIIKFRRIEKLHVRPVGEQVSIPMGCTGKLDITTTSTKIEDMCDGIIAGTFNQITDLQLSLSGKLYREVETDLFGFIQEGLVNGVKAYGVDSQGKPMQIAAVVVDFSGKKEIVVFPNVSNTDGFARAMDNASKTEVPDADYSLQANADEYRNFAYFIDVSDKTDDQIKDMLENWTPADAQVVI